MNRILDRTKTLFVLAVFLVVTPSLSQAQRWLTCHSDVAMAILEAEDNYRFDMAYCASAYTGQMYNDCAQAAVNGYALAMTQAEDLACYM